MWNKVVFSDESKFNVFGSDGRLKVWRKKGEGEYKETNTYKTVQGKGGNVMVQRCITSKGFGKLYRIQGKMDKDKYISILSECLLGTLSDQQLHPKGIIFNKIMIQNIQLKLLKLSLYLKIFFCLFGQLKLQI